jgi:hypothetical protein
MVVVSHPDKNSAVIKANPGSKIRELGLGKRPVNPIHIIEPANNARTNVPTASGSSDPWSQWCTEKLGVANKHNPQDG